MSVARAVRVAEASQAGEARRTAAALAREAGFDEAGVGKVALVTTEVATNVVKHGRLGEVFLRALVGADQPGIEIVAVDRGPGMDVDRSLRDGHSTAGSPGTGLGAIRRLSDVFDLYSAAGRGTVLLARLWSRPPAGSPARRVAIGGVTAPHPDESVCGDAWAAATTPEGARLLVVDGLGHGLPAAEAARAAVAAFEASPGLPPAATIETIHGALRSTRGAAVAVAELGGERICYAGVGNIAGAIVDGATATRSLVSHNGTVGHRMSRVREFSYPWSAGALVVLHSDGLVSHWSLGAYPDLVGRHPSLVAAVLYRDFRRLRDDAAVVVARSPVR